MKKKTLLAGLATCMIIAAAGCGNSAGSASSAQSSASTAASSTAASSTAASSTAASSTAASSSQATEGTIQSEIAAIEAKSQEFVKKNITNLPQQEMNKAASDWYQLWDNELNSLWNRITAQASADKKEKLLAEQREWIKKKSSAVEEAVGNSGGTLKVYTESITAKELTEDRVYYLASVLAELKGEKFQAK